MKRKLGIFVIATALLAAASGCGEKPKDATSGGGNTDKKSYQLAISQYVEHPSLDATRNGILAALKDAGLTEGTNLKVDYNNAQNDSANNLSIAQKIASGKNDLVIGIATPSAQALVQQVKNTPVLFAAVTDPINAKIVSNMDRPGGNVTGASDTNPEAIVSLMDFIAANFPKVKKIGVVINEGESNAVVMAEQAKKGSFQTRDRVDQSAGYEYIGGQAGG